MDGSVAAGFGILLGCAGACVCGMQLRNLRRIGKWKSTPGKITKRGTFRVEHANMGAAAYQNSPLVVYAYRVGEREFTNDAIYPRFAQCPPRGAIDWAADEANAFPDEVEIFYNPDDPSDSFLKPPPKIGFVITAAFSILAIGYSILALALG